MSDAQYHLPPIPDGMQIFEERLEVAGVQFRRDEARRFANGRGLYLEFERDCASTYDRNAIKVIGCRKGLFGTKRDFIGYVPKEVAANIVEGGYFGKVVPRLLKTWIGDTGYVEILFQIIGPKGQRLEFQRADPESLPASKLGHGAHYADYVNQVRYLKQEARYEEAVVLLNKLIDGIEKEARKEGCGVAPWYYEQLAIVYKKLKRPTDELAILERYDRQPKAPGAGQPILRQRLEKARGKANGKTA